jgi:uncharacterized protein with PQ loop repeat
MDIQLLAGSLSSMIFALGTLNMVYKAWRTKDMQSYSLAMLVLNNVGNLVYWIYVMSLPFGPIHVLHSFYTVTTLLMLGWWFMYRHKPQATRHITQTMRRIVDTQARLRVTDTMEVQRV